LQNLILIEIYPTNCKLYKGLADYYLIDFYKSQLTIYKENKKIQGNLNFYLGNLYLETDKKLAKKYFRNAKKVFKKVYEKDHDVFRVIDSVLE
jgi:hypothetical protein